MNRSSNGQGKGRGFYGIEATQAVLGHAALRATEIYAERNAHAAMKIAAEVG